MHAISSQSGFGAQCSVFFMRVALPDRPGTLGAVASAVGAMGADIHSIEIVDAGDGTSVDDFLVSLPAGVLPDSVVSACQQVADAKVLWISRHYGQRKELTDLETLHAMAEDPSHGAEVLVDAAPALFHCQWAVLVDCAQWDSDGSARVTYSTPLAPDLEPASLSRVGDLTAMGAQDLDSGWVPGWSETVVGRAPVPRDRAILVGRTGGPPWLDSELGRLRHLASMSA